MRISDWSSDVCSSDLLRRTRFQRGARRAAVHRQFELCRERGSAAVVPRCVDEARARHARAVRRSARGDREYDGRRATLRGGGAKARSEEHTSELQSLMRISYAVFCLKKTTKDELMPGQ